MKNSVLRYKNLIVKECSFCKNSFESYPLSRAKYCSRECYSKSRIGKPTWNKGIKEFMGVKTVPNCKCKFCGKEFHLKPYSIKKGRGKYCSKKCYGMNKSKLIRDGEITVFALPPMLGKNNPSWRGGRSFWPYPADWTKTLKEAIRQRDGYKCRNCGCPQEESLKKLSIHHIDYNKQNCNPENLITLCNSCHCLITEPTEKRWGVIYERKVMCK